MLTTLAATTAHVTPNASMHRYATTAVAVWRTEMAPGSSGPTHAVDREQTVVVLEGTLHVVVGDEGRTAAPGDAVTIPAGARRRLANGGEATLVTLSAMLPGGVATVAGQDAVPIPWAG